ncbi:MAG: radical SAM protein [Phycisphaerae bacterium]
MSNYVFGPVPSRRLGRSLGVDLVPFKTCSFDCIYCQLGRTTCKTMERKPYVPVNEVIEELAGTLRAGVPHPSPRVSHGGARAPGVKGGAPALDYVTLSGSGEPTLHSEMGEVVQAAKGLTEAPVAVLTNGSLLWDDEVRRACAEADIVIPTLAAHDESSFQRVHRPYPGLTLRQHVDGLVAFREEYTVPLWLELFVLEGINTGDEGFEGMASLISRIRPHRIQLNTAVRPTSESSAVAVSPETLRDWASRLGPKAEVIADYSQRCRPESVPGQSDTVLALCRRRPCTLDDIAATLGLHRNEATKYITELLAGGRLIAERRNGREYFMAKRCQDDFSRL